MVTHAHSDPADASETAQWTLWQLADSAFPAGGFAHSGGLEAVAQGGEVNSASGLHGFIHTALRQLTYGAVPFVRASLEEERPFNEIDWLFDAFTPNHVSNRASRAQGRALLASAERTFAKSSLTELRETVLHHELPGHFAPVFGAVARALDLNRDAVLRLFVFVQVRGWISSAVRLGIVGPLQGQAIQHHLAAHAQAIVDLGSGCSLDDTAQTAPLLDLFQGTHDRLYSRLFQS
jgi:urease accessory protein